MRQQELVIVCHRRTTRPRIDLLEPISLEDELRNRDRALAFCELGQEENLRLLRQERLDLLDRLEELDANDLGLTRDLNDLQGQAEPKVMPNGMIDLIFPPAILSLIKAAYVCKAHADQLRRKTLTRLNQVDSALAPHEEEARRIMRLFFRQISRSADYQPQLLHGRAIEVRYSAVGL